jgi:hypothetical protein
MSSVTTLPAAGLAGGSAKSGTSAQYARGTVKLFAKYPAHNNYVCSYEVFVESDIFKPDAGRSAMIYFLSGNTLEASEYEYGRFRFFLPKSVQPIFEEALSNRALVLTVQLVVDDGRPVRDQTEAIFRLQTRDQIK